MRMRLRRSQPQLFTAAFSLGIPPPWVNNSLAMAVTQEVTIYGEREDYMRRSRADALALLLAVIRVGRGESPRCVRTTHVAQEQRAATAVVVSRAVPTRRLSCSRPVLCRSAFLTEVPRLPICKRALRILFSGETSPSCESSISDSHHSITTAALQRPVHTHRRPDGPNTYPCMRLAGDLAATPAARRKRQRRKDISRARSPLFAKGQSTALFFFSNAQPDARLLYECDEYKWSPRGRVCVEEDWFALYALYKQTHRHNLTEYKEEFPWIGAPSLNAAPKLAAGMLIEG